MSFVFWITYSTSEIYGTLGFSTDTVKFMASL